MNETSNPISNATGTVEPSVVTFTPDVRVALGQRIVMVGIGVTIVTLVHHFKAGGSWLNSVLIGLGIGVVMMVFFAVKAKKKGIAALALQADSLVIEDKTERLVLPWDEIEKAEHYLHGEFRWEFVVRNRCDPVKFPLEGFLQPQMDALKQALVKRLPCEEVRTPWERRQLTA
jgi:hypothetical protein